MGAGAFYATSPYSYLDLEGGYGVKYTIKN